jgi:integrase
MTQHENQRTKAETVQERNMTRKPKIRGTVRVRKWKTHGVTKTAWQADFGYVNGNRLIRSYATKNDAENWLREQTLLHENQGIAAFSLTEMQRLDAVKAFELLKPTGTTLEQAARYYVTRRAPDIKKTVAEVIAEYLQDAETCNLRPRTIRDLEHRTESLASAFEKRLVSEITRTDADKWLASFKLASASVRKYRVVAHGVWQFAIDRGYAPENPFTASRLRRKHHEDEQMPVCLSSKDVEKIMQAAVEVETSMIPALAVGFFAGLRTAELRGLDWKDIDLAQNRITVIPEVAKRRRARHVEIEGNLMQWLTPYRQESGLVAPDGEKWRSRLDAIREKAEVKWPHNAMRHSYASHHLAKYGDKVKTAFALGHGHDAGMLFEHYRALTTPEDGAKYFEIKPQTESNVIQLAKVS